MDRTNLENIYRYTSLAILKDIVVTPPTLVSYLPDLSDSDYENGYITRHFAQKANDDSSPITEIEATAEMELKMDGYYKVSNIRWRLIGTPQQIMDSNKASIELVKSEMKNLKLYLSNLLQFARVN
jgi:hypothetical protein